MQHRRQDGPPADIGEIRRALDLLVTPGGVVEIRGVDVSVGRGKPIIVAGYFDDPNVAAAAVESLETRQAGGVYLTLNEIHRGLLARSPNQLTDGQQPTTADSDVTRRRWLLLDFDATRPADISASEDEHCAAQDLARKCSAWLTSQEWPSPIFADSGNGAHLLYRIDLPANDNGLVRRCLEALAGQFDNDTIKVDQKVFNPARISKLYGTTPHKGHSIPERPHRPARLIDVPGALEIVPVEKLEAIAAMVAAPVSLPSSNGQYDHRLDVPKWLSARSVAFQKKDRPTSDGRTVYVLERCPFDSSHGKNGEVSVMQRADGALSAACMHNSCTGRGWQQFKEAIGAPDPDHYDPPLNANNRYQSSSQDSRNETLNYWEPKIVAMNTIEPRAVEWLWKNRIPNGKLVSLSGNPGLGKTLVLMDIAARVSTGAAWPDGEPGGDHGGVVICSAEDDPYDTLRPRLDAAGADVSRINLVQSVVLLDAKSKKKSERLIDLQQDHDAIGKAMDMTANCKLLIMDPINAYLGKTDSHKNAEVRQILGPVAELCHRKGVAFIYLGHLNKSNSGPAMYRTAGSLAFIAAARVAYIVAESKEDPNTRLFLPVKNNLAPNIGGLSFQVVTVDEQPRVQWNAAAIAMTADEALSTDARGARGNVTQDKEWLAAQLAAGPRDSDELMERGKAAGISRNRMFAAKKAMGAYARKLGIGETGKWEWYRE
jgi:putative DNA primase/helicase